MRQGGIVLIDNVLWGGSVANLADKDADTQAIRALNAKLEATSGSTSRCSRWATG